MLPEAIAVLAGAGGTAVVQAMVSDGWESTKARLAQLLGRGDPERARLIERRLESSRTELKNAPQHGLERARQAQAEFWQGRLSDLLNEHPQLATELRKWLQQVQPDVLMIHAAGSSQVAFGTGIQINEFFGPSENDEIVATIAVPTGRRYEHRPLRGRDELIAELLAGRAGAGARVRVLHGLGGGGKSSVALEVACRAQDSGGEVWWVQATDAERVTMGMLVLARRLGLSDAEIGHRDVADLVWQRLATRTDPWLLVFDNADDPDALAIDEAPLSDGTGWLRPVQTTSGMVIVTSRQGRPRSWGGWCHLHGVGMLSPEEGAQVLIDNVGDTAGDRRSAESLARRLGGLPLALRLAASYLAQARRTPAVFADTDGVRTFAQYQAAVDDRFDMVFPSQQSVGLSDQQARQMIGRTWELSLAFLDRSGTPEARPLLRLLACMGDAPTPYELLLRPSMLSKAAPFLSSITGAQVWEALQALASNGLIELPEATDAGRRDHVSVLRLHPLVRDTSRPGAERREYFSAAIALLLAAVRPAVIGLPEQPAVWPVWQTLVPHVLDALKNLPAIEEESWQDAADAAYMIARHLAATGAYRQADTVYRRVHSIRDQILGADHPLTLNALYGIARMAVARGNYGDAEVAYRGVLSARERVLGARHPDTLNAHYGLARLAAAEGHYGRAEAAYRDILAIEEQLAGIDHPDTLRARYGIARMLGDQGRYEEAEAMYRALLVLQERFSEQAAPGKKGRADVYREVLAVEERVVGTDRPDALTTRYAIARIAAAQGRYDVAESAYREVLAVEERDLGPTHPDTLNTRHWIARMVAARGDHRAAEDIFRQVLAVRRKVLGPDHPNTLTTQYWLAHTAKVQGRLREAQAAFQEVLTARETALGHSHPKTRQTRRELEALQDPS